MKSSNNFTRFIFSSSRNVRTLFLFLFGVFGLIIAFISFFVSSYYENKSINEELYDSAQSSFELKIATLENRMKIYENILYAINESDSFHHYVKTNQNKNEIQEIFRNSMITVDELMQIRYIDKNGLENIRIDKNAIASESYFTPDNKLQNKKDRYYFKETKEKNLGQIWRSKIDLNVEKNKIIKPFIPTLRLALPIYTNSIFNGIIIINIFAEELLEELVRSALFKVSIVDKNGDFLHYEKSAKGNIVNYSWSKYLKKDITLEKEFPSIFKQILQSKQFSIDGIFSYNLSDNFYNPDGLILLYEFDDTKIEQMKKGQSSYIITVALIIFIISIPISFLMSITPVKLSNELLKAQEEILRESKIIDKYVAFSSTDLDANIVSVSKAFCDLTGYSKSELIGSKHSTLSGNNIPKKIYKKMYESLKKEGNWNTELQDRDKKGNKYWVDLHVIQIKDKNNSPIGYHSYIQNITSNKILRDISITDGLTNLFNRRYFDEVFEKQIKISARDKKLLAFTIMDIDHFKQYNDTYGHQDGDSVLKKVSLTITTSLNRADDYIFRLGGEEFGMLYFVENKDDAFIIADQTRKSIEGLHIKHVGNSASPYITISMGLSIMGSDNIYDKEAIYKITDQKLYQAKKSGRNKVIV